MLGAILDARLLQLVYNMPRDEKQHSRWLNMSKNIYSKENFTEVKQVQWSTAKLKHPENRYYIRGSCILMRGSHSLHLGRVTVKCSLDTDLVCCGLGLMNINEQVTTWYPDIIFIYWSSFSLVQSIDLSMRFSTLTPMTSCIYNRESNTKQSGRRFRLMLQAYSPQTIENEQGNSIVKNDVMHFWELHWHIEQK